MNENLNGEVQNNYVEPQKNNNGLKTLLIILIILFVAILILLSYKFLILDKKDNEPIKDPGVKENLDEIANNLFSKIENIRGIEGKNLFLMTEIGDFKLLAAYSNLDSKLVEENDYNLDKCSESWYVNNEYVANEKNSEDCLSLKISKKDFEKSYKDLFGLNSTIEYKNFYVGLSICNLENDYIKCYAKLGGVEGGILEILKLEKYEKSNDNLVLYINTLKAYYPGGTFVDNNDKEIDNDDYYRSLLNSNNVTDELSKENKEKLFEHYKGKTIDYKLTFKKDSNGNYYYVNTELLK